MSVDSGPFVSFQKIYGLYGLEHLTVEINGDVTMRTDGQTNDQTSENRATQSMDSVRLSFAKIKVGAFLFQLCRGSPSNHLPCKHWQGEKLPISYFHQCNVRLEIVDLYLLNPQVLYWGTAKWSPVEIFETFSMARYLKY